MTAVYRITATILFMLFSTIPGLSVLSQDILPTKYERCGSCHGALGISHYTYFPNIAGQKKTYLVNQLRAFRDGSRTDPWMSPMANDLSDDEIDALAAFYSEL